MDAIFAFGHYGSYISWAYGISAAGLIALTVLSWRAYERAKRRTKDLEGPSS